MVWSVTSVKGSKVDAWFEMTGIPTYYKGRRIEVIKNEEGKVVNWFDHGKVKLTDYQKCLAVLINVTVVIPLFLLLAKALMAQKLPKVMISCKGLKKVPKQGVERDLQKEKEDLKDVDIQTILTVSEFYLSNEDQTKLQILVQNAQNPRSFEHIACPNYHPLDFSDQEEDFEVYLVRIQTLALDAIDQIQIDDKEKSGTKDAISEEVQRILRDLTCRGGETLQTFKTFLDLKVKHCFALSGRLQAAEELQVSLKKIAKLLPDANVPQEVKAEKLQELAQSVDLCSPTWLNLAHDFCRLLEGRISWEEVILKAVQDVKEDFLLGIVQSQGDKRRANDDHWNGLNEIREGSLGHELGLNYALSHLDNTHQMQPNPRLADDIVLKQFTQIYTVHDLLFLTQNKINRGLQPDRLLLCQELTPEADKMETYFCDVNTLEINELGVETLLKKLKIIR